MEQLVDAIVDTLQKERLIQIEVSARHVHLNETTMEVLFGKDSQLTKVRELSQTGQYLSKERVNLIGPKGRKDQVAILGPLRSETQVEVSKSDCVALGVEAPVRQSGDVKNSGTIILEGPNGSVRLKEGVIIAQNHVHMTPKTANHMKLKDQQHVKVSVLGKRPLIYQDVLIRVHPSFRTRMHIDFDEANAALIEGSAWGKILTDR